MGLTFRWADALRLTLHRCSLKYKGLTSLQPSIYVFTPRASNWIILTSINVAPTFLPTRDRRKSAPLLPNPETHRPTGFGEAIAKKFLVNIDSHLKESKVLRDKTSPGNDASRTSKRAASWGCSNISRSEHNTTIMWQHIFTLSYGSRKSASASLSFSRRAYAGICSHMCQLIRIHWLHWKFH